MQELVEMFMLNTMQTKAFKFLTNHNKGLHNGMEKELLLVVAKITTTGKLHILMTFKGLLESFNHGHWILVGLLTSTASKNINGLMLHSLTH